MLRTAAPASPCAFFCECSATGHGTQKVVAAAAVEALQTAHAQGSLQQVLVAQPSPVLDGHAGMEPGLQMAAAVGSFAQEASLQVQQGVYGLQTQEPAAAVVGWAAPPAEAKKAGLQRAVAAVVAEVGTGAADQGAAVVGVAAVPVLD
mmetsp:Transcript_20362/g.42698  ORF Transcript_20362/g.42698 Transcript_20362/m.42698 type:complete len:148 (-) Transcript_20362:89-532(-)